MTKSVLVLIGLLCLIGTASAMGSTTFNLSWDVIGGGGGSLISPSYSMGSTVGQITGLSTSTSYRIHAGFWVMDDTCGSVPVIALPGYTNNPPTDPDGDCIYEDLNGNGRLDFADVVLYFNQMEWIAVYEPVSAFDLNGNGRIDFADIVKLFGEI
jgi:PKD repeat protein